MKIRTEYPSLEAFYDADPRRRTLGETDYGVWWLSGSSWPNHRVTYIQATGEVYAVQLYGDGPVEVLGAVPPDEGDIYYRTLDRVLEGWAEHCGSDIHGLSWVRQRLALYGYAAGEKGETNATTVE